MASIVSAGTTSATALNMSADTSGVLQLASNNGVVALTVSASQGIGIGTASPTAQLEISRSATDAYSTMRLSNTGASGKTYEIGVGGNTAASGYGNNLYFYDSTASTLRMVLDSAGVLGLGTIPLVWSASNNTKVLQLGSVTSLWGNINTTRYSTNYYNTTGDVEKAISTNYVLEYMQDSATGSHIWFNTSTSVSAGANATMLERMRVIPSGYFKATSDGAYVDANGNYHEMRGGASNGYTLIVTSPVASPASQYVFDIRFSGASPNNGSARFWNASDSTATRGYFLSNGGLANYQANNGNLSDRREKTNFAPAKPYLDVICAIPVQTFNYIDQNMEEDGGLTLGVVAQDVQEVAPELVAETNWGTEEEPKMRLSIYQTDLQYALMKSIQELNAKVTALENK